MVGSVMELNLEIQFGRCREFYCRVDAIADSVCSAVGYGGLAYGMAVR